MSRSGYSEDVDGWDLIRWRGAVASAIKGNRGQQLISQLATAMDAMPVKRLIDETLVSGGEVCALGCVGRVKGIDMSKLDPEEPEEVAKAFGVAPALVQEIAFMNDEYCWQEETPEQRWIRMRKWVGEKLNANQGANSALPNEDEGPHLSPNDSAKQGRERKDEGFA